jgi:hypothetical protein
MKQMDGRAVVMKLVADGVQRIGPPIVIRHEEPASSPMPIEVVETPVERSPAVYDAPLPDPVSE